MFAFFQRAHKEAFSVLLGEGLVETVVLWKEFGCGRNIADGLVHDVTEQSQVLLLQSRKSILLKEKFHIEVNQCCGCKILYCSPVYFVLYGETDPS